MVIINKSDLKFYYSGGASKNTQTGDQGGAISSVQITDQDETTNPLVLNTIIPSLSSQTRANGGSFYYCIYLRNTSPATATDIKIYTFMETPSTDTVLIGYSGNVPNTLEQLLQATLDPIYNVPTSSSVARMDDEFSAVGQIVANDDATIYGKYLPAVKMHMERNGDCNGQVHVGVWEWDQDPENDPPKLDYGTIDANDVPTDRTLMTFNNTNPSNQYELDVNDAIMVYWDEALDDGSSSEYIDVVRVSGDKYRNSHQVNFDGQQWRNVSNYDVSGQFLFGTSNANQIAPSNITFYDPKILADAIDLPDLVSNAFIGIWLKHVIPPNTSIYNGNKHGLNIVFNSPST